MIVRDMAIFSAFFDMNICSVSEFRSLPESVAKAVVDFRAIVS